LSVGNNIIKHREVLIVESGTMKWQKMLGTTRFLMPVVT